MPNRPLDFVIDIEPKAVQSARFFRCGTGIRSFQPKSVNDYKHSIRYQALAQLPPDFAPIDKPISLRADIIFAPPQSMRKRDIQRIAAGEVIHKRTRPDVDNLTKGLFDALNGTVWTDDAVIVDYRIRKYYGEKPAIRLSVQPFYG